ncbi:Phenylalanine--tRNA ligase alpha subunit [Candidatus Clavichlamydia salmonicola]|uniref:phenylalanine--tRNA ligase subunit alpha n=1 Tax=Candidatus Clavichlamydia salmonicola TaxID=469812 RepID=UPI001891ACD6|nr:phenylalanine--tRNA ligase subunit alpha [Candidatus Clavichlamydia salmonicola]MBF5050443.1 Phenylalanine--tRNA ligase alpha subunit [Candidatus Clavichlamydia salmonicola]
MNIEETINLARIEIKEKLAQAKSSEDLEVIKIYCFGKKGLLKSLMDNLKSAQTDQKPLLGKVINDFKVLILDSFALSESLISSKELQTRLNKDAIDESLPGLSSFSGKAHLLKCVREEIIEIFKFFGFIEQDAPHIESDEFNFDYLNFEDDHPAREMHDTFYIAEKTLLRTHTSNVQVRAMQNFSPPMSVVSAGPCFRNEDISSRSHIMFHQIEACRIEENATLSDLLALLKAFFSIFFNKEVEIRSRFSYFPFVEPGLEIDVSCFGCGASGCRLCKQQGFLEVAGAGMIHPNVLKQGRVDSEKYSGYALGMGLERLVMLRHGISDIRLFLENDLRFLNQF